jgi:threonylcarbamoyladenosine tRNA methylthiotransferase MtaB
LDELPGIERYRISSIEPNLLTDEIIEFVSKSKKFMPHFHIPLQSGSDTILQAMRRRYRTDLYRNRIERIKQLMPDACIGVDVIVGFPGETEELFKETQLFLSEMPASYFHVFTYSERDNTTALRIAEVVPMETRFERNKILRIMSEKKKRAFYSEFLQKERKVLWESEKDEEMISGFTDNYIKVRIPWNDGLPNTITNVNISSIDMDCIALGELA